jgi:O-acetyl-ADP-ribose deacetylase (regulator of RNase III)
MKRWRRWRGWISFAANINDYCTPYPNPVILAKARIQVVTMPAPLQALQTNIVTLKVDAIVNAANTSLLGGGGVDGAIHHTAGPELLAECRTLNGCKTGQAKITRGYKLPAKHVIHTVGPVWRGGHAGEADLLASCYRTSLALATKHSIKSIAFPAISCGVYGYPLEQAVAIAVRECRAAVQDDTFDEIIFACFDANMLALYEAELAKS